MVLIFVAGCRDGDELSPPLRAKQCAIRDLLGSGTISGPGDGEAGALIELSRSGAQPVDVGGDERRSFVEDGDAVVLRGWCERPGFARIGFGESRGEVMAANEEKT